MFTGIVSETGVITSAERVEGGMNLRIECSFASETKIDESIAVNGVCLTVVGQDERHFRAQVVEETLRKTNLGDLRKGDRVNLERSLTLQKAIDGHIVQGHVDTTGRVEAVTRQGQDQLIEISFDPAHAVYLAERGSICLDGISLTVARLGEDRFTVAIIPYTWDHTNLNMRRPGDRVNLEFDIFGKYIVRYMELRFSRDPDG